MFFTVLFVFFPSYFSGAGKPAARYSLTPEHSAQWALNSAGNAFIKPQSVNLLKNHNNVCARSLAVCLPVEQ